MTEFPKAADDPDFTAAWAEMYAKGYQYSEGNIEKVHIGWCMARQRMTTGTHAYELIAAAEQSNVEVTTTLISMVAATVLAKLIEEEGGGRSNVSFSPADMDAMHRDYEMATTVEGLITTVRIAPREGTTARLMAQAEDTSPARPQAKAKPHDRPVWAMRAHDTLFQMKDQADAERQLPAWCKDGTPVTIENRMCMHSDCPSMHCNHVEVTSEG